jgi:hypothetical protein
MTVYLPYSQLRQYVEVSCQFKAPSTLPLGNCPPGPIEYETGLDTEPV